VPKALILGVTGQDGSYLSELLLSKGYEVHGVVRRSSSNNTDRIDSIFPSDQKKFIHYGDLEEGLDNILTAIKPDEIYNLAAQSHVGISFEVPIYTGMVNAIGVTKLLESIKRIVPEAKYYQASSSEMFGTTTPPQSELSVMLPVSPYGCAKLYAYHMTRCYRTGYKLFATNGILFNHESERRGLNFVTRKIARAAARIRLGLQKELRLGNLDALRDWGHSKDYVRAMWMIMQAPKADDWVVSTGEYHTVREYLERCFDYVGMSVKKHVVIDESYQRPNEVPALLGNSSKIREKLGWKPEITFDKLIEDMVKSEIKLNTPR
jgi:GDPmannose 4,6-dehydratase